MLGSVLSDPPKTCRECHWWIPVEHAGDTGRCRRFPPTVVVDYFEKKLKMMSGEERPMMEADSSRRYGVFPMTLGSTWCGEWTEQRHNERNALLKQELKNIQESEKFAQQNPGAISPR
jgi:hypothetical protein